jgi:hypothetical protein
MTIGIVGVILFLVIGVFLNWTTAGGFRARRRAVRCRGLALA